MIWEKFQKDSNRCARQLNEALEKNWEEWEIPREADDKWSDEAQRPARRMVEAAHCPAEGDRRLDRRQGRFEYLYDKPYEDNKKVRVAGRSRSRACRRIACCTSTKTTN